MMYEDEDYEEFDTYYPQEVVEEETWMGLVSLTEQCLVPTLQGVTAPLLQLLASCLLFRLVSQLMDVPMTVRHVTSAVIGLSALIYYFHTLVVNLLILVVATFVVLAILTALEMKCGPITALLSFTYLVGNEFFLKPESWQKIRGAEMLVVMKVVSVAFDLDSGALKRLPDLWQFSGYTLCVGTSVFGVWCSFHQYENIFRNPVWNVQWVRKAGSSIILALISVMFSVCFVDWLLPQHPAVWCKMYMDALQFRTSHYFVSYLSEAAAVLSGFGAQPGGSWQLSVTEPHHIELPHSLVQVVVYWNKHIHMWLKVYIFRTSSRYGGLAAVLATYVVSSLLHGLNYPLAAVLMSLGVYTYVEYSLRARLSVMLNACIAARPCPALCTRHAHTSRLLPIAICNWLLSVLAMFHLAYLGCIIDTSDARTPPFPQAFQKWSDVHYLSHWVVFATYILYFYIK